MSTIDEQSLYYELGYGFDRPGILTFSPLMNRLVLLLLLCSLILQIGFGVSQILTILLILVLLVNGNQENINFVSKPMLPYFALFLVMISALEQWTSGVKIPLGGNIFQAISIQILLLNLIWVGALIYLLFLQQLSSKSVGNTRVAIPLTTKAEETFAGFKERLKLTAYDLQNEKLNEGRSLVISFYLRVVFFVILAATLLSLGTVLFWRFYLQLSDRVTVEEEYDLAIFSLLSFVSLILVLSSTLSFSSDE
ncbi:MAG: hypothetical protein D6732_07815 [Methanobacteriota archaeon]|nr:MAG: hypothetical protein D6732_07815 [Euryarchaeota archaeon]